MTANAPNQCEPLLAFQPGRRPLSHSLHLSVSFLGVGGQKCDSCRCLVHVSKVTTTPQGKQRVLSFRSLRARGAFLPARERGRARVRTRCPLRGFCCLACLRCVTFASPTLEEGDVHAIRTFGGARVRSACCVLGRRCFVFFPAEFAGRTWACCGARLHEPLLEQARVCFVFVRAARRPTGQGKLNI